MDKQEKIEYPKAVYRGTGDTLESHRADSAEHEEQLLADGWRSTLTDAVKVEESAKVGRRKSSAVEASE